MKNLLDIIYIEWMKQYKKTSFKAILAIVILLATMLPVVVRVLPGERYSVWFVESERQYVESMVSQYQSPLTPKEMLIKAQNEELLDFLSYYEVNLNEADYRVNVYRQFSGVSQLVLSYEALNNGVNKEEVANAFYNGETVFFDSYLALTSEERVSELEDLKAQKADLEEIIKNKNYSLYAKQEIAALQSGIEENHKMIASFEATLKENQTNVELTEQIEQELENHSNDLKRWETIVALHQYLIEHKVTPDENDWRYATVTSMISQLQVAQLFMETEAEYEARMGNMLGQYSYKDYVHNFEKDLKDLEAFVSKGWYSLNHNIPQLGVVKDARVVVDQLYEVFTIVGVFTSIIIGGAIVSQEFSTGTIRLLLIRPVSRVKVLLAKMITALICGVGAMLLGIILLTIVAGVLYDFNSFSFSVLTFEAGNVIETSFLAFMSVKVLVATSSVIFMTFFAVFLSTVFKNTAMSVSVSMILYLIAYPLTLMMVQAGIPGVQLTPLPYLNLSLFNLSPSVSTMLEVEHGFVMNQTLGMVELLIATLIFGVFSISIFKKSDIKN